MEILSLVQHNQRLQDLKSRLDDIQDEFYLCKFTTGNQNDITEKIENAFNKYNEGNRFDYLGVSISFDKVNCRINMDISQRPLIENLSPYFTIQ